MFDGGLVMLVLSVRFVCGNSVSWMLGCSVKKVIVECCFVLFMILCVG